MTPPPVGRDAELGVLEAAVARAEAGQPTVVLVTGDAGIGKSHLVGVLRERAGALVVGVACDPAETTEDYGVIGRLARAAPLPAAEAEGLAPRPGTDPLDAGAALLRIVDGTQLTDPLVVVVDDAHWADRPSLDALTFAARRLRADRVALVVTCRTENVDELPVGLLRLAGADGSGVRIDLAGLDPSAVGELAGGRLGRSLAPGAVERLHAHTGGNPLHVTALMRELPEGALDGAGPLPAPRSYARLVLARMAACGEEGQQVMAALAVLGLRSPVAVVTEVAVVDEPLSALDEVVAAGLAVMIDEPGSRELAVAHPLVRAAILEDLAPSRLAAIHRDAGRSLPGAAGLGHRIAGAVGHDAGLAAEARSVAAAESSAGAHAAGARLLLEGRRVEPDVTRADADLLAAVDNLLLAGELTAAAAQRARVDSLPPSARRDAVLGHLAYVLGPRADARRHLERAWSEIDDPPAPADVALAGRIAGRLATIAVDRGDGAAAQAWVRRSRRLAPEWAGEGNQGHMLAMSHALLGRIDEGIAELTADLDRVAAASPPSDAPPADLLLGRGVLRMWAGDLAGAEDDLAACLASGAGGTLVARETARYSLAELHFRAGRWDAAVVAAEVAAAIADAADQAWIAPFPHAVAVYPLAARGEWARAEEHLAAARAAAERAAGGAARLWIALAAARLAESRGDPAGIVAVCDPLARGDRSSREEGIASWRATYTEALVAVGRMDDAGEVLAWLAADVGPGAGPGIRADLARAEVVVAVAAGDRDRADGIARCALDDEDDPAGAFSRARLELVAGGLWRSGGAPGRAVAVLERARGRFEALGAEPWRARAENELARAGRRPARRQPTAAALTPQEQAVVHVVAGGRSNREAAAELFISVKTVEHHLSRAYAKLGVRSRAELVGIVAASRPPG